MYEQWSREIEKIWELFLLNWKLVVIFLTETMSRDGQFYAPANNLLI